MSSLPPPPQYASAGFGRNEALEKVSTPGMLLAIAGGLGIFGSLISLVMNIVGAGIGSLGPAAGDERIAQLFSGGLSIVLAILSLIFWAVVVLGGLKMRSLES